MSVYDDAVATTNRLMAEISEAEKRHRMDQSARRAAFDNAHRTMKAIEGGIDPGDWTTGRRILDIHWGHDHQRTPQVVSCFQSAIKAFRENNLSWLRRGYYGVKSYDRFDSQRSDHEYGYGPTHGTIWFRIGLSHRLGIEEVTEEERIACVRYLQAVMASPSLLT